MSKKATLKFLYKLEKAYRKEGKIKDAESVKKHIQIVKDK